SASTTWPSISMTPSFLAMSSANCSSLLTSVRMRPHPTRETRPGDERSKTGSGRGGHTTRPAAYSTPRETHFETGRTPSAVRCASHRDVRQQPLLPRPLHGLAAVVHPELAVDGPQLGLDRVRGDEQPARHRHHRLPLGDRLQHPQLPAAELHGCRG